jgi:hypothetical protein
VPALSKLVSDREISVRREAVFALGQVGHRSARTVLEGALADRDAEVVALAVEALGKLGEPAVTSRLTPFLAKGTPTQRMRACESLWRLADSTGVDALIAALADRDPAVRWRVLWALEKLPQAARIVPAVAPLLSDADALVRAHAARRRRLGIQPPRALMGALDGIRRWWWGRCGRCNWSATARPVRVPGSHGSWRTVIPIALTAPPPWRTARLGGRGPTALRTARQGSPTPTTPHAAPAAAR